MPSVLVGRKAPHFIAAAVGADGQIVSQYDFAVETQNKNVVLFFYPLDFTFVCPSELIALDKRINEFKKRNTIVLGISIDSQFSHNAWRNIPIANGGIGPVQYALIADVNHQICQSYGVEHPSAHVALRAAFIIDKNGMVRSQIVNDLPLGRNVDEILRLLDALEFHEQHGEVCPAGWTKGARGMVPTAKGVAEYLSTEADQL